MEAESKLRAANIVVRDDRGMETVEGKQLLEICGFSTLKYRDRLREQIKKHNFKEGYDFMRSEDQAHNKRGQKPVLYHFTVNARS